MEFILNNIGAIIISLAIIAVIIFMLVKGQIGKLKQLALHLVTMAEKEYGDGTGKIKFSAVAEQLYSKLPSFIGMFISAKTIECVIEWAVAEMKEFLVVNSEVSARLLQTKTTNVVKTTKPKTLKKNIETEIETKTDKPKQTDKTKQI